VTNGDEHQRELEIVKARLRTSVAQVNELRQTRLQLQKLLDTTVRAFSKGRVPERKDGIPVDGISFIVAYYDIPDQLERTLISCSPGYQDVPADQLEVIIADNGSPTAPHERLQERHPFVSKVVRKEGQPSPVFALNDAIQQARFSMIAIMIDGAHILSPGIARSAMDVAASFARPVISVPQYILGDFSQNLTSSEGAFERERQRLEELNWPRDGYALFSYALFPGESPQRDYLSSIESNCLITSKEVLEDCGAFDERFEEPGAGFANLELFSRLSNTPDNHYVVLPGEGSFHQDHDGTTTGKSPDSRDQLVKRFKKKYETITGRQQLFNFRSPFLYGEIRRSTQQIPSISREFGQAKQRILRELAEIYVSRASASIDDGNHPVLAASSVPMEQRAFKPLPALGLLESEARFVGENAEDRNYKSYLRQLHKVLEPRLYFEIGVSTGSSLELARCSSIGVDPAYHISRRVNAPTKLFPMASDQFFESETRCDELLGTGIDLAFIDGMHLAEYVLRDIINVERWCNPNGVIVLDDVLPEQIEMAARDRIHNAWCGDVYKIIPALREYRPDLKLSVFEAFIGPYRKGLAVISNLNPLDTRLSESYDEIRGLILGSDYSVTSIEELEALVEVDQSVSFTEYVDTLCAVR